jgi:hypothetical protein
MKKLLAVLVFASSFASFASADVYVKPTWGGGVINPPPTPKNTEAD